MNEDKIISTWLQHQSRQAPDQGLVERVMEQITATSHDPGRLGRTASRPALWPQRMGEFAVTAVGIMLCLVRLVEFFVPLSSAY